jgi:hypothetical protein
VPAVPYELAGALAINGAFGTTGFGPAGVVAGSVGSACGWAAANSP